MTQRATVSLDQVLEAQRRIAHVAVRTPLQRSRNAHLYGCSTVAMKLENRQATGAFKFRGAANAILALDDEQRRHGVVTASSGNHGRAVAHIASGLGIPAIVCLSTLVPETKVSAIRRIGAEVIVDGADQDAAIANARRIETEQGMAYIDPSDDLHVVAGQGTIGLELLEDAPDLDVIFVQVSGGGLAAGIGVAVKAMKPEIKLIGVSMELGAAMYSSLMAGRPTQVEELRTLADALQGGIGLHNRYTFDLCRQHLDDFILLSEDEIASSMRSAFHDEGLVLEGAGACGFGALRRWKDRFPGGHAAVICSGANVGREQFESIVGQSAATV